MTTRHRIVSIRQSDARPDSIDGERICSTGGCDTVLSRYNTSAVCGGCDTAATERPVRSRRSPGSHETAHKLRAESRDDD